MNPRADGFGTVRVEQPWEKAIMISRKEKERQKLSQPRQQENNQVKHVIKTPSSYLIDQLLYP